MADGIKQAINALFRPEIFFTVVVLASGAAVVWARLWVRPRIALSLMAAMAIGFGFALTDEAFREIALAPDNVAVAGMIFLLVAFTWLGLWRAVDNDRRRAEGRPLFEEEGKETYVTTWPHFLYVELIVGVFATAALLVWSILLPAPLEGPANDTVTPAVSKAPWYFLGLQELLVYFDPWIAGVAVPALIIAGLLLLPYLDPNPKGNGYYTIEERPFAVTTFSIGFLGLWIGLIVIGVALRGPNWNFFGPFEPWDVHKQPVLNNVNLSDLIFLEWLRTGLPSHWLKREAAGLLLVAGYFVLTPLLLLRFRTVADLARAMGRVRYHLFIFLMLAMTAIPIKMLLRWTLNLKYVVAIPEIYFNI